MAKVKLFCVLSSMLVLIAACSNPPTTTNNAAPPRNTTTANAPAATPAAATPMAAASGKDLYAKNCANCHKETGTGGEVVIEGKKIKPDNLTSDKIKGFSDEKIIGYVTNGVEDEGMPAFKDKLSADEIKAVVAYVRSDLQKMPAK
jgi:mono/diheme cytochrome c family protein